MDTIDTPIYVFAMAIEIIIFLFLCAVIKGQKR